MTSIMTVNNKGNVLLIILVLASLIGFLMLSLLNQQQLQFKSINYLNRHEQLNKEALLVAKKAMTTLAENKAHKRLVYQQNSSDDFKKYFTIKALENKLTKNYYLITAKVSNSLLESIMIKLVVQVKPYLQGKKITLESYQKILTANE